MDDITALSYYGIVDGPSFDTIVARLRCQTLPAEPYFVCQGAVLISAGPSHVPMLVGAINAQRLKFDLIAVRSIVRLDTSKSDEFLVNCLTGFDWKSWRTLLFRPSSRSGHFIVPTDSDPHFRLQSSGSR